MTEERYEIRGKIGQGGVGAVYKAYDTQLRRDVAIKRVLADEADEDNETATQNLLKEATALSSVQHPHICTVYDAGIDDEGPFVVMEFINGKTLDQMVEKGTLTYEDFREVALQSQEAMIAAQELNLVHRDLKPSNVMVSWLPSGRFQIKLVDFGLAKFSAKPSLQTIDHGDSVFGSIFFMAPEQFERVPLDQRTDMYSLGAMFYYTLAGHYPFDGDSAAQVMASHLQGTVVPLQQIRPDLPIWLCEWVMWHIQRDMNHRPSSAKDALNKFLHDEGLAAQGGLGATQQLITPGAPKTSTVPLLIPAANTQAAGTKKRATLGQTQAQVAPTTGTQQILTPAASAAAHTAPQQIAASHSTPVSVSSPASLLAGKQPPKKAIQPMNPSQEALFLADQRKDLSKTSKIAIFSILGIGIIISLIILVFKNNDKDENLTYTRLIKGIRDKNELPVTKDELNVLLNGITESTNAQARSAAYVALTKAKSADKSFSAPLVMAKLAVDPETQLTSETRKKLFEAISFNKPYNISAYELMLEYAKNNPDEPAAEQAVGQIRRMVRDEFFDDILAIHDTTKQLNTKNKCAKTLVATIEKSNSKEALSKKLIDRYQTTDEDKQKLSYIRIMGATGTDTSLSILSEALKHENPIYVQSATRGLSKWPNLKPFPDLVTAYSDSSGAYTKKIRKDIMTFLTTNKNASDDDKIEMWKQLLDAAPDDRETRLLVNWIANEQGEAYDTLLQYILTIQNLDQKSKNDAIKALERRKK